MRVPSIALYSLTTLATCNLAQVTVANAAPDSLAPTPDHDVVEAEIAPEMTTPISEPHAGVTAIAPPETIVTPEIVTSSPPPLPDVAESVREQVQPLTAVSKPERLPVERVDHLPFQMQNAPTASASLLRSEPMISQVLPTDGVTEPGLSNQTDPPPEPLDPEDTKDELGEIRILPRPAQQPPPRRQADLQILLRSGVFSSSNITALDSFKPGDTVFSNTGLLLATPQLGPTTRLVASAGGGAIRFANKDEFNYNLLHFNVGIQQRLTAGMYAQLGWAQEQLYRDSSGARLLLNNAVDLTIGRQDPLGKQLRLDSFYNLRAGFANPAEQSRVANTLGARLRYDFTPNFQGALDYRLTFKNYTEVDRADTEHQVSAIATYTINPNLFVAGTVSYLFGRSSNSAIDLNNFSAGIVVGLNVPML